MPDETAARRRFPNRKQEDVKVSSSGKPPAKKHKPVLKGKPGLDGLKNS